MLHPIEKPNAEFLALESAVMEWLIRGTPLMHPEIVEQYARAVIFRRELSGTGFFSTFRVPEDAPRLVPAAFEVSVGASLMDGLDVGFTLFVRDGCLGWLEGYAFGDTPWPDCPVVGAWEAPSDGIPM